MPGEAPRMKNVFQFLMLVTKIQGGDTDIAVNSLELVIPCENL